jgi:hypothetical protein
MNTTTPTFPRSLLFTPGRYFEKVKPMGWGNGILMLLIGSAAKVIHRAFDTLDLTYTSMTLVGINTLLSTIFYGFILVFYARLIDAMAQISGKPKKGKAAVSAVFYSLYPALLLVTAYILIVVFKAEWGIELLYTKQILQGIYAVGLLWSFFILVNGIKSIYGLRTSSAILVLLSAWILPGLALVGLFLVGSQL